MASANYGKVTNYEPPEFASGLPNIPKHRVELAMLPTPIHKWNLPDVPPGFEVCIKRDDLTGNLLSGNKVCRKLCGPVIVSSINNKAGLSLHPAIVYRLVRPLEFSLAEALTTGHKSVLTAGAIQSNQCRATAVAAKELGLECHLILFSQNNETEHSQTSGNVLPYVMNGCRLYLVPGDVYPYGDLNERVEKLSKRILKESGKSPYFIPVGGANNIGMFGYIEAWKEMIKQGIMETVDDIVVATGSAGTLCGLGIANYLTGQKIRIHGIGINEHIEQSDKFINITLKENNITGVKTEDVVDLIDGYEGEGYGKSSAEDYYFVEKIAKDTGIFCELVYTGKALKGMLKEMKNNPGRFKGDRVLFMHTGGTMGLFDGKYQSCVGKTYDSLAYKWPVCEEEPKLK